LYLGSAADFVGAGTYNNEATGIRLICSDRRRERARPTERKFDVAVVKSLSYGGTGRVIDIASRDRYRGSTEVESSANDISSD